jgi:hypothetical protein
MVTGIPGDPVIATTQNSVEAHRLVVDSSSLSSIPLRPSSSNSKHLTACTNVSLDSPYL